MDIDEFLDRELSDLDLPTGNAEKQEMPKKAGFAVPEFKLGFEPSPLFEAAKVNLARGNLEQAEQAYTQLWRFLAQKRLKWDREMHEQLLALGRQFSSVMSQAYNDVKSKANHVYELISRARAAIKDGKKELPFKLYSEMQEINSSIPSFFFEEKKMVQDQILSFYNELKNTTDNEIVARVAGMIQQMHQLLDKTLFMIKSNNIAMAVSSYEKCLETYNQVPEGFLKYKNQVSMRLLDVYKSLSIYMEISDLQNQLNAHLTAQQKASQPRTQARQGAAKQPGQAQQPLQQANPQQIAPKEKSALLDEKKSSAKENIKKNNYREAMKDIEEALKLEPNDPEAMAMRAKITTLQ